MSTLFYIIAAITYLGIGLLLALYGVGQGEPFSVRTVVAWPLVLLGH